MVLHPVRCIPKVIVSIVIFPGALKSECFLGGEGACEIILRTISIPLPLASVLVAVRIRELGVIREPGALSMPCIILPLADIPLLSVGVKPRALSMPFTILPLAVVLSAIWPRENTMAFLLIIDILALILAAVRPHEDTSSVHFVHVPFSSKLASI